MRFFRFPPIKPACHLAFTMRAFHTTNTHQPAILPAPHQTVLTRIYQDEAISSFLPPANEFSTLSPDTIMLFRYLLDGGLEKKIIEKFLKELCLHQTEKLAEFKALTTDEHKIFFDRLFLYNDNWVHHHQETLTPRSIIPTKNIVPVEQSQQCNASACAL